MPISDLRIADLNPSLAILPLRLTQGSVPKVVIDTLAARLETLVSRDPKSGDLRKGVVEVHVLPPEAAGKWIYTGAIYRLDVAPSWVQRVAGGPNDDEDGADAAGNPRSAIRQLVWHLALVGAAPGQGQGRLVVHATQDTIAERVREFLVGGRFGATLAAAPCGVPFDDRALQAVCLDGEARQAALWGLHRTVKTKPDRKTLMGLDLKEAVDPFSDQTYRLTSAVSIKKAREPEFLGLSLKRQRVWSQKGATVGDLSATLDALFDDLEKVVPKAQAASVGLGQRGFRDLAKTSDPTEIHAAKDAFEAAFRPLTSLDPAEDRPADEKPDAALRADQELAWFADGSVRLGKPLAGPGFTLEVARAAKHLVTLTVTPIVEADGVALSVRSDYHVSPTDPDVELFESLTEGEGLSRRLAVWYDTGHVLVDRQVSLLEYRDVRFDSWKWRTLKVAAGDVVLTQEKPQKPSSKDPKKKVADLTAIGLQRSLFEYILEDIPELMGTLTGPLWAICDDGAGEIADFIFYAPVERRLWLVHAKGADSGKTGRGISVAAYEQVVSQARKNLRFFEGDKLAEELAKRGAGKPPLWRNGVAVQPNGHAAALTDICDGLRNTKFFEDRCLVVVQPHVSQARWKEARELLAKGRSDHKAVKSYRLLSALLADLQMTAQKVDAGLVVIGEASPSVQAAAAVTP